MDFAIIRKEYDAAIAREDWEAAAICLIVGMAEFMESVRREGADAMFSELEKAYEARQPRQPRASDADRAE